jgi:signal transduction histidine kinase
VAHQINNPLGSIVLYAHILLEEYGLGPEAQADVRRIVDDAQRCQTIVQELLDFARQSRLDIRPQDINRALARTIFLLEGQPLFRDLRIVQEFDPDLPLVPADLQQLNHVFLNLVLNAADAMEGRGTLTLKTRVSGNGRYVQVEVTDTGPGIPGAILPRIFDPFFTTKEEGRGTGLGLSVAYGVVQNHGGRLTVCSAPGEGSAFVMELPLVPDAGTERRP